MRILVKSGILKRLVTLILDGGTVSDEGARILVACPDLQHLELLTLSRNYLTSAGVEALKATGVRLNVDDQYRADQRADYYHLW